MAKRQREFRERLCAQRLIEVVETKIHSGSIHSRGFASQGPLTISGATMSTACSPEPVLFTYGAAGSVGYLTAAFVDDHAAGIAGLISDAEVVGFGESER